MKRIIITGANRGLGLEIAKALGKDHHVIMACRNVNKAQEAILNIEGSFDVLPLDVTSIESIDAFVLVIKEKYGTVDVLINNAGMYSNEASTIDFLGKTLDKVWVTNTLGPYVLTEKLMRIMLQGYRPRIIFMNSVAGHRIRYNSETLKGSFPKKSYGQSKRGTLMLGRYFQEMYPGALVLGTHPGYSRTEIFEGIVAKTFRDLTRFATRLLAQPARIGALGAIEAVSGDYPSGVYLVPKLFMELYGKPKVVLMQDYYREKEYEAFVEFLEQLY